MCSLARRSLGGGGRLPSFALGEQSRNYDPDKIDQKMRNHVRKQITTPQIERCQQRTDDECRDNILPATGPMSDRKNQDWNCGCPKTAKPERLQPFNRVAAIK